MIDLRSHTLTSKIFFVPEQKNDRQFFINICGADECGSDGIACEKVDNDTVILATMKDAKYTSKDDDIIVTGGHGELFEFNRQFLLCVHVIINTHICEFIHRR